MKLYAAYLYIVIGAILYGASAASYAKRCDQKIGKMDDYAGVVLLWPAIIVTGLTLAVMGAELDSACKAEVQE